MPAKGMAADVVAEEPQLQLEKKARNLRKKIAQAEALTKVPVETLNPDQVRKLRERDTLVEQLQEVEDELEDAKKEAVAAAEAAKVKEDQAAAKAAKNKAKKEREKAVKERERQKADQNGMGSLLGCKRRSKDEPQNVPQPRMQRANSALSEYELDPAAVEDLAPPLPSPVAKELKSVWIEGLQPWSKAVRERRAADEALESLLAEVSALSEEAFEEDCASQKNCSVKSGWRLTILQDPTNGKLQGFVMYRVRQELGCMSINKIAIAKDYRRLGLGSKLVRHLAKQGRAKKMEVISLSSLKEAVVFYKRLGFRICPKVDVQDLVGTTLRDDEELLEGQEYMEMRLFRDRRK